MTADRMIANGELTRMAILALVGREGPTSRADMARELDLSGATVTKVTRQLIDRGILEPLSYEPSEGGRPGQLLGLVATAGHAIGVKVATDHLAIVDVQLDGRIVETHNQPFDAMAPDSVPRWRPTSAPSSRTGAPRSSELASGFLGSSTGLTQASSARRCWVGWSDP